MAGCGRRPDRGTVGRGSRATTGFAATSRNTATLVYPPTTSTRRDSGLGWCAGQRTTRRDGRLGADRVAALDAIGLVWDQIAARVRPRTRRAGR